MLLFIKAEDEKNGHSGYNAHMGELMAFRPGRPERSPIRRTPSHPEMVNMAIMGPVDQAIAAREHLVECVGCYSAILQPRIDVLIQAGVLEPGTKLSQGADPTFLFRNL